MKVNDLFVYGTLKNVDLFESAFNIIPVKSTDSSINGELYLAEWYPLYLRNKRGIVNGKNLSFRGISKTFLERLDEYEQTKEGIFVRKQIVLKNSGLSWIYEANPNNEFVKEFICEGNKIKSGIFELNEDILERVRGYLR
ncbi:MAG: gamma-glutamylcyclotransferase [Nanoarchaeota archaeon]|nr:gamma-glutamylcyclotransferase [Nanoarchaeota archaeon]